MSEHESEAEARGDKPESAFEQLHEHLRRLEHDLDPSRALHGAGSRVAPAWQRVSRGESRLVVTVTIAVAIGLMLALPSRVANHPKWLLPGLAILLLIGILIANPTRLDRPSGILRVSGLLLIGVITAANVASAARLVNDLVSGQGIRDPETLLLTGGAIWLTNMIVFALWYWEFDSGGPVKRALEPKKYPDLLFPQMTSPELAPEHWEPRFADYLYLSFTNATAFSPTDVLPLTRWFKLTMLLQSVVSLAVVVLVIARAVNILK